MARIAKVKIKIDIERNTLVCGLNGGNVRLAPGSRIRWSISRGRLFRLEFFRLPLESDKPRGVPDLAPWPFAEPPRPATGNTVGPTDEFEGTLGRIPGAAFKYCVAVGNLRLDPIIIIDN